ncbi:hypothetical protein IF1G_10082 [Cordyceps javanica]|uniref:Uncharacterized protein n=1 Tax=Cordyceps javanica TaxID=43265 RepID=A0A545VMR7_9HYPO|nr:hypothetical protein IF1G_10082 [Cordyceps javanica]TQW03005.1 hypothetical protein IF2G_09522 [Cordyceps javanica]
MSSPNYAVNSSAGLVAVHLAMHLAVHLAALAAVLASARGRRSRPQIQIKQLLLYYSEPGAGTYAGDVSRLTWATALHDGGQNELLTAVATAAALSTLPTATRNGCQCTSFWAKDCTGCRLDRAP